MSQQEAWFAFVAASLAAMARHINDWSDTELGSPLRHVIYSDFPAVLDAEDRAYFRATRERAPA